MNPILFAIRYGAAAARRCNARTWMLLCAGAIGGWVPSQAQEVTKSVIPISRPNRSTPVDFEREILPMLKSSCLACHNKTTTKGDLNLETPALILKGGESGPAVVPGKPSESLMLRVATHESKPKMPPKDNKVSAVDFTPEQLGLIQLWIEQGAKGEVRGIVALEWQLLPESLKSIFAVAVTADGRFAACARANQVSIYDLALQEEAVRLVGSQAAASLLSTKATATPVVPTPSARKKRTSKSAETATAAPSTPIPGPAPVQTEASHVDWVNALAFSPDGTRLASAAYRDVKIWQRAKPVLDVELPTFKGASGVGDLSLDGTRAAVAEKNGVVRLIDTRTRSVLKRVAGHTAPVTRVLIAPNSSRWVSVDQERFVRITQLHTFKTEAAFRPSESVSAAAWDSEGSQLFLGLGDGAVQHWTLQGEAWIQKSSIEVSKQSVQAIAASDDGGRLVFGTENGEVGLVSVQAAKTSALRRHGSAVTAVALATAGGRFASGGADGSVRVWTDAKPEAAFEGIGDRGALDALAFADRSAILATNAVALLKSQHQSATNEVNAQIERDKKAGEALVAAEKAAHDKQEAVDKAAAGQRQAEEVLKQFETQAKAATDSVQAAQKALQTAVQAAKPLPDADAFADKSRKLLEEQKKALTQKQAEAVKAVEAAKAEAKKTEQPLANARNEKDLAAKAVEKAQAAARASLQALESGNTAATAAAQQLVEAKAAVEKAKTPVRALAFTQDHRQLRSVAANASVQTWIPGFHRAVDWFRASTQAVASAAFDAQGNTRVVDEDGSARSWKPSTAWALERVIGNGATNSPFVDRVTALRFSPDSRLLATGGGQPSRSSEIKLWNVATGALHRDLTNVHSDVVFSLDFSADGKFLASCSADRFAKVVDLETGAVRKGFEGHTDYVLAVRFRADGRGLVTGAADNLVKVWDAVSGERKRNVDGAGKEVTGVAFVGLQDHTLSASGDGQLRINNEKGEKVRSYDVAGDYLQGVDVTPGGEVVVAGGSQGVLRAWEGAGKALATFAAPTRKP